MLPSALFRPFIRAAPFTILEEMRSIMIELFSYLKDHRLSYSSPIFPVADLTDRQRKSLKGS